MLEVGWFTELLAIPNCRRLFEGTVRWGIGAHKVSVWDGPPIRELVHMERLDLSSELVEVPEAIFRQYLTSPFVSQQCHVHIVAPARTVASSFRGLGRGRIFVSLDSVNIHRVSLGRIGIHNPRLWIIQDRFSILDNVHDPPSEPLSQCGRRFVNCGQDHFGSESDLPINPVSKVEGVDHQM